MPVTSNEMILCLWMLSLNKPRLKCFAAKLNAPAQVIIEGHSHLERDVGSSSSERKEVDINKISLHSFIST
jgi:hypothetical protein